MKPLKLQTHSFNVDGFGEIIPELDPVLGVVLIRLTFGLTLVASKEELKMKKDKFIWIRKQELKAQLYKLHSQIDRMITSINIEGAA